MVALAVDVAEGQIDVPAIAGTLKGWATFKVPDEFGDHLE